MCLHWLTNSRPASDNDEIRSHRTPKCCLPLIAPGFQPLQEERNTTDTRHFWQLVLEKYSPRAGDYKEIYDYLAEIRPDVEISESKPYTLLYGILQTIHEQRTKVSCNVKILGPRISSSRSNSRKFPYLKQSGFTVAVRRVWEHSLCKYRTCLVWLANQTQTLPKFWDRYFQRESDPNFSFGGSTTGVYKPASNSNPKKRKRDVRETQRQNAQRARQGKARQASLAGLDVDEDIL